MHSYYCLKHLNYHAVWWFMGFFPKIKSKGLFFGQWALRTFETEFPIYVYLIKSTFDVFKFTSIYTKF